MWLHSTSLYRTPATIVDATKQGLTDGWADWDVVGATTYGSTSWQSGLGHEEDYDNWIYHDNRLSLSLSLSLSLPFVARLCVTRDRRSSLRPSLRGRRVEGTIRVILLDPFQTAFFGFNPSSCRPHHVAQLFWFISWLHIANVFQFFKTFFLLKQFYLTNLIWMNAGSILCLYIKKIED